MRSRSIIKTYVILGAICISGAIGVVGCGRKPVVLSETDIENNTNDSDADSSETSTASDIMSETKEYNPDAQLPIAEMTGVTDSYKWKEDVLLNSGESVRINAEICYMDESEPSVVKTVENPFTAADKKTIAEYLFDKDSIGVDLDNYPTRQSTERKLEDLHYIKGLLEEEKLAHGSVMTFLEDEENVLLALSEEAPEEEDIDISLKDYTGDYYVGTYNGIRYGLSFNSDTEEGSSSFTFEVKDYNDVIAADSDIIYITPYYENMEENKCGLSSEELRSYSDKIFGDLEFENLGYYYNEDLVWCLENGGEVSFDGYRLYYALNFNDVYLREQTGNPEYLVSGEAASVYPDYQAELWINDSGIIRMEVKGNVDIEKIATTKLLGYENVKECIREALRKKSGINGAEYDYFSYDYIRTMDEGEGGYVYIPAWILEDVSGDEDTSGGVVVINAIDGSEIEPEKYIHTSYITYDEWRDDFRSWYLIHNGYDGSAIGKP